MGANSHNYTIDESAKPWSRNVTHEKYEIAVGLRCNDCRQLFNEKGKCKCRKKK